MRSIHELGDEYSWDYEESLEDALGITFPYDLDINILCEDKDNEKKFKVRGNNGDYKETTREGK